jgi:hypothetical protein
MSLTFDVTPGYRALFAFYFGTPAIRAAGLAPGRYTVTVRSRPELAAEGNMNANGALTGMSPLYRGLALRDGDVIEAEESGPMALAITGVQRRGLPEHASPAPPHASSDSPEAIRPVFQRQQLRALHIEMFSPENLNRWEPATETDVYMAFGVLQEYTRHRYCCATSQALLDRLGFNAPTKPDAILIDNDTREYLVAEFKMRSSAFALNHRPEDVDVLVVWEDDVADKAGLPREVVCLREIARQAAQELIRA